MKKVLTLLLSFILIISITACNNDTTNFNSEDIVLNAGSEYELQGMLTIPVNATEKNKVPAVVLVQGSGGSDMDESAYSYKVFKDIADYLSANGIAVIRYDKRTYTHTTKMAANYKELTIKEETIDDAIAAADLLRANDRIDSDKVFILGHSLGGMVAPRIDAEGGNFAGIIIWAGSPRTFGEIWLDQAENELLTLPDEQKELGRQQIDAYKQIFDSIKDMSNEDAKESVFLGASLYYYKDLDAHPAESYLRDMTKPILIMQGGKDFQVFADIDYVVYQEMLDGKDNVTFKLYPELNHFFITSTTGMVDEYKVRDTVSEEVLKDITDWIKAN